MLPGAGRAGAQAWEATWGAAPRDPVDPLALNQINKNVACNASKRVFHMHTTHF